MKHGIKIQQYVCGEDICRFYGSKRCPCVSDRETRKKYDIRNGFWATGRPLPECGSCPQFERADPDKTIPVSFQMTLVEYAISQNQSRKAAEEAKRAKRDKKTKRDTPIQAKLLQVSGGTAAERASKMLIGGALFGDVGAIIGLLGKDEANVKLIFQVTYADGNTGIVVERGNSPAANQLLNLANKK